MTTKFEIDIADAAGCESSLRTIFKAMDRLHGTRKTGLIVRDAFAPEPGSPQALAALEFRKVRRGLKPEDLGLLLAQAPPISVDLGQSATCGSVRAMSVLTNSRHWMRRVYEYTP